MDMEKELIELKGKQKMDELRLKALIKLLSKEGEVSEEEVEDELNRMLEGNDEDD